MGKFRKFEPKVESINGVEYTTALGRMTQMDYGVLRGMIEGERPSTIPSDMDLLFEHKGHFVFGEWKGENLKGISEKFGEGQWRVYKPLKALNPSKVTVIQLRHRRLQASSGAYISVPTKMKVDAGEWTDIDTQGLKDWFADWWKRVENENQQLQSEVASIAG